jgi:predicted DsbA family dithiol-disulfide isomerase
MTSITITHYTDPGCPFAWSAEPARRRLQWLYGDQLEWRLRMAATLPACRAVVAVRRHAPEQEAQHIGSDGLWALEPVPA